MPGGDAVVPALNAHIADAAARGWPVYASCDWHPKVTRHFKPFGGPWPPHCVQDTKGASFHKDLRLPAGAVVITKGQDPEDHGYSAFEGVTPGDRPFLEDLRERGIDHLYIGGLATDYCVKQSALDARRLGFRVTVLRDAIAGVDVQPGDSAKAIAEMQAAGAELQVD